jgi:hypothetical protein
VQQSHSGFTVYECSARLCKEHTSISSANTRKMFTERGSCRVLCLLLSACPIHLPFCIKKVSSYVSMSLSSKVQEDSFQHCWHW